MRHKWTLPSRPSHLETVRTCERCGLLRVTRHEGWHFWTEWRDTDGRLLAIGPVGDSTKTPPCENNSQSPAIPA